MRAVQNSPPVAGRTIRCASLRCLPHALRACSVVAPCAACVSLAWLGPGNSEQPWDPWPGGSREAMVRAQRKGGTFLMLGLVVATHGGLAEGAPPHRGGDRRPPRAMRGGEHRLFALHGRLPRGSARP